MASGFRYELSRRKYPSVAQELVKEEQEKKIIDKRYVMTAAAVSLMIAVVAGLIWGVVTGIIAALACMVIAVGIGDASGYEKADYKIQNFEELLKIAGIE